MCLGALFVFSSSHFFHCWWAFRINDISKLFPYFAVSPITVHTHCGNMCVLSFSPSVSRSLSLSLPFFMLLTPISRHSSTMRNASQHILMHSTPKIQNDSACQLAFYFDADASASTIWQFISFSCFKIIVRFCTLFMLQAKKMQQIDKVKWCEY